MKKALILILTLCASLVFAAPATYNILALATGSSAPTIDGDVTEWPDCYLVDSLKTIDNVYCMDDTISGFDRNRLQYYVYATHDVDNVYYAIKVVADNKIVVGGTYGSDCIKINPGGQAAAFYVWSNNTIQRNPSNPYTVGVNMDGKCLSTGNAPYPTYEFYIAKATLDQFGLGSWQISVGMEDNDRLYLGIGVECKVNHTAAACWNSNPWDNQLYYPTWVASTTEGCPLAVEHKTANLNSERLSASPNPFTPSTFLSYNVKNNGTLKIYDVNGKMVRSFATKAGAAKVQWDGANAAGQSVSSGIYVARLVSGKNVLDQKLFLTR
jgi:hypothetical protein